MDCHWQLHLNFKISAAVEDVLGRLKRITFTVPTGSLTTTKARRLSPRDRAIAHGSTILRHKQEKSVSRALSRLKIRDC
ncbi:hypothetical protein TNCT_347221 [Trichonephila clavata]|uniref:Uncharacterized protein n=1 Tax=Trichonephila clavata TaxID=2740835 RepID=A0A8X6H6K3_TRICU|nr:hypothetical protein TNCT_347221 [Trichonephila clavata]